MRVTIINSISVNPRWVGADPRSVGVNPRSLRGFAASFPSPPEGFIQGDRARIESPFIIKISTCRRFLKVLA